jgi:hypothetical protein
MKISPDRHKKKEPKSRKRSEEEEYPLEESSTLLGAVKLIAKLYKTIE